MIFDVVNLDDYSKFALGNTLSKFSLLRKAVWSKGSILAIKLGDLLALSKHDSIRYNSLYKWVEKAGEKTLVAVSIKFDQDYNLGHLLNKEILKDFKDGFAVRIILPGSHLGYLGFYNSVKVPLDSQVEIHHFKNKEYVASYPLSACISFTDDKPILNVPDSKFLLTKEGFAFGWSETRKEEADVSDFIQFCQEEKTSFSQWGWEKFSYEYEKFLLGNGQRINGLLEGVDYTIAAKNEEYTLVGLRSWKAFQQETFLQEHCIGKGKNYYNKSLFGTNFYFSLREGGLEGKVASTIEISRSTEGVKHYLRCIQQKGFDNAPVPEETQDVAKKLVEKWAASKFGKGNVAWTPTNHIWAGEGPARRLVAEWDAYYRRVIPRINRLGDHQPQPYIVDYDSILTEQNRWVGFNLDELTRLHRSASNRVQQSVFTVDSLCQLIDMKARALGVPRSLLIGDHTFSTGVCTGRGLASEAMDTERRMLFQMGRRTGKTRMFAELYGRSRLRNLNNVSYRGIDWEDFRGLPEKKAVLPSETFVKCSIANHTAIKGNEEKLLSSALASVESFKIDFQLTLPEGYGKANIPEVVTGEFTKFSDPKTQKRRK